MARRSRRAPLHPGLEQNPGTDGTFPSAFRSRVSFPSSEEPGYVPSVPGLVQRPTSTCRCVQLRRRSPPTSVAIADPLQTSETLEPRA